jgi:hypothetical protein
LFSKRYLAKQRAVFIDKLLFDDAVATAEFINEELDHRMITCGKYFRMEWRERFRGPTFRNYFRIY